MAEDPTAPDNAPDLPAPRPARGLIALFLRATGHAGICLPPFGIFLLPERLHRQSLIRHEECHWMQARRMGPARWAITYLWYHLTYGYRDNPLEQEARHAASAPARTG
jgi:hypothetical protein